MRTCSLAASDPTALARQRFLRLEPRKGGAPAGRPGSELQYLLADNQSLKAVLDDAITSAYRCARRKAAIETEMPVEFWGAMEGFGVCHKLCQVSPS